jgi:signal peptidase I
VREYAEAILFAVVLTVIIRMVLLQAFRIPSGSMEDTLKVGDFLFVNKFLYGAKITVPFTDKLLVQLPRVRDPRHGDIIVFRNPQDPSIDYIKRCEGVPGDVIEVRDKQLFRNGKPVYESYVKHIYPDTIPRPLEPRDNFGPYQVQPGQYFMMGDNRDDSRDSRWFMAVDQSLLRGKAIFIYWSWDSTPVGEVMGGPIPKGLRFGRLGKLVR